MDQRERLITLGIDGMVYQYKLKPTEDAEIRTLFAELVTAQGTRHKVETGVDVVIISPDGERILQLDEMEISQEMKAAAG